MWYSQTGTFIYPEPPNTHKKLLKLWKLCGKLPFLWWLGGSGIYILDLECAFWSQIQLLTGIVLLAVLPQKTCETRSLQHLAWTVSSSSLQHGDAVNSEASDSAASPDAGGSEALLEKQFPELCVSPLCLFAGRDLDGCELFGQSESLRKGFAKQGLKLESFDCRHLVRKIL